MLESVPAHADRVAETLVQGKALLIERDGLVVVALRDVRDAEVVQCIGAALAIGLAVEQRQCAVMVGDGVSESTFQAKQSAEVGQRRRNVGPVPERFTNRESPFERVERAGKVALRPIGEAEPVPGVSHACAVACSLGAVAREPVASRVPRRTGP